MCKLHTHTQRHLHTQCHVLLYIFRIDEITVATCIELYTYMYIHTFPFNRIWKAYMYAYPNSTTVARLPRVNTA